MNISKRIISTLIVFCLFFCHGQIFADEGISVTFENTEIIKGEEGKIKVSLENTGIISTFYLYNLGFDDKIIKLTDVKLLVENASLSHTDKETGEVVFAFSENTVFNGDIAEFTFEAKGKAAETEVKADVRIKYHHNGNEIYLSDVNIVSGKVNVVSEFPDTMVLEDTEKVYNGKAQGIKVKNLPVGASVAYLVDGEEKEAVKAGEYVVTAKVTKEGYADWESSATLRITPAPLKLKGLKAKDKVYDGKKDAAIDSKDAFLDGIFEGDEVYTEYPETGTFETENVKGVRINVNVEKPALFGKDSTNYTLLDVEPLKAKITKATQEINVSAIGNKTYGDEAFYIDALASSGLPLTYKSENENVAKILENGLVEITGAGKAKIAISQSGNENYLSANTYAEFEVLPKIISFEDIDFENEILTPAIESCGIQDKDSGKVEFDFSKVKSFVSGDKVIYTNFFFKGERSGNYKVYIMGDSIEKELVKEEGFFSASGEVTASVKKASGTSTLIVEDAALTEFSAETQSITIDLNKEENGNIDSVILPGEFLSDAGNEAALEIKLTESSVLFDKAALTHLADNAEDAYVNISIREADDGELHEGQVEAKEKLNNSRVFKLTVSGVGEEERVSFGGGKAKVSLPYEASGSAKVKVKYLKDDGTTVNINSTYDKKAKKVTVTLSHFSEYVVYTEKTTSGGGGGGGGGGSSDATLKFNTNGGKEMAELTMPLNTSVSLDKYLPEKDGFKFSGWFMEPELKTIVTEIKLQGDTTLYAKWKELYEVKVILTIDKKEALLNGQMVVNDVAPEIVNGRTMLPIRFIAEALKAEVGWDGEARKVTIKKGEKVILLTIGKDIALIDGKEVEIDSSPYIKDDRTYLPLRFIAENLDCTLEWNEKAREVTVKK